jgi:long-subunit acyl-CoA synthetase (AMP-forming)
LTDDVIALKPTIFVAVPRVLERIQTGIQTKLRKKGFMARSLFNFFLSRKIAALARNVPLHQVCVSTSLLCSVFSLPRVGGGEGE